VAKFDLLVGIDAEILVDIYPNKGPLGIYGMEWFYISHA
jgi:hypothetical protein